MKYKVQARKGDRWVTVGHPHTVRAQAFEKLHVVMESGLYDHVRIVVEDLDGAVVELPAE